MTTTTHLGMTLIDQSQAQKEVTVNTALTCIDALLNTGAISRSVNTPPGSPSSGDLYIVGSSPTSAWSGYAGKLTYFDQTWRFITPRQGLTLWVNDESLLYVYNGSSWASSGTVTTTGSPSSGHLTKFSGTATITSGDLSGDITTSGTLATTLATVNSNVGSFGDASHVAAITVNAKGLITTAAATAITPAAIGAPSGSGTCSGTNTGDQTITLTGNVTGSGAGSFATTIASGVVTNAMLAGSIDLTSKVTNALPIANGGTGNTTARAAMAALKGVYILGASAVVSSLTGTTSLTTLATIAVPANAMGANGRLLIRFTGSATGTNAKSWYVSLGGTTYTQVSSTTQLSVWNEVEIANRNATNSQVGHASGQVNFSTNSSAIVTSAIDTTVSQNILISGQLTNSGETITLESYIVELYVP